MGVDTAIRLPQNVRVRDVANIIGALSGKKVSKVNLQDCNTFYVEVEGVKVVGVDTPGLADITIECPFSKAATKARLENNKNIAACVLFHYESHFCSHSCFLMIPPSTPYWIAIGKGLIDFFGGSIAFNDCDNEQIDYCQPTKNINQNSPEGGKDWDDFENRILNLKPLTKKDFDFAEKHAAYK